MNPYSFFFYFFQDHMGMIEWVGELFPNVFFNVGPGGETWIISTFKCVHIYNRQILEKEIVAGTNFRGKKFSRILVFVIRNFRNWRKLLALRDWKWVAVQYLPCIPGRVHLDRGTKHFSQLERGYGIFSPTLINL